MKLQREWVTPLTIGSFALLAVTGVLMFFHLDSGLNKVAHEWLSWALVAGVGLHAAVNWPAFRRHLAGWHGRAVLTVFALLLAISFIPLKGGGGEPPFMPAVRALVAAPLPVLAQVARTTPEDMRARLQRAGLNAQGETDSVRQLVGDDVRRQVRVLGQVMQGAGG